MGPGISGVVDHSCPCVPEELALGVQALDVFRARHELDQYENNSGFSLLPYSNADRDNPPFLG